MSGDDISSKNLRKRMRKMIEDKKVDPEEATLLLMESNLDVMISVQRIYDLPMIRFQIFVKRNKRMGAMIIFAGVVLFELWHVTEFRDPIMKLMGLPTGWIK